MGTTVLRSVELLDFSSLGWGDADALQLSKALPWCCALTDLRLNGNKIGPSGASAIAEALKVKAVLTNLNILANRIGMDSANMLLKVKEERSNLVTLCGITLDQKEASFLEMGLGPADALLLSAELKVNGVLTTLDLSYNYMTNYGQD